MLIVILSVVEGSSNPSFIPLALDGTCPEEPEGESRIYPELVEGSSNPSSIFIATQFSERQ